MWLFPDGLRCDNMFLVQYYLFTLNTLICYRIPIYVSSSDLAVNDLLLLLMHDVAMYDVGNLHLVRTSSVRM